MKNNNLKEKVIRLEERLIASEKALNVAHEGMQERLAGMNEFRDQLRNQAATFIARKEFEAKIDGIEKSKKDNLALGISLIGVLIAFSALIILLLR